MKKLAGFFKANRKMLVMCAVVALAVASMSVSVFAADEVATVTEVLTTSFQQMVTDAISAIGAILPIAMTIFSIAFAIGFSIKWFKKLVGMSGGAGS